MTLIGFLLALGASLVVLFGPRAWAAVALFAGTIMLTLGQVVIIGPLHFYAARILIGVALLRVMLRGEYQDSGLNRIDKAITVWAIIALITRTICYGNVAGLVSALGETYTVVGVYIAFRCIVRSTDDAIALVKACSVIFVPLAIMMTIEKITVRNGFALLGGVPELALVRAGTVRAQGPFAHPILAGTAGSAMIPLFAALWFVRSGKIFAVVGVLASIIIAFVSGSSGPVLSAGFGMFALVLWRWRIHVRLMRNLTFAAIIGLEIVMKAHVWALIGRVGNIMGSTGFHRTALIDSALVHFSEWWKCGTMFTRHWMPTGVTWSANHTDITSEYISMAVNGGMPLLLAFFVVLICIFSANGRSLKNVRTLETVPGEEFFVWAMGASMLVHTVSFLSVAYFDQVVILYYLLVAMIGSVYVHYQKRTAESGSDEIVTDIG